MDPIMFRHSGRKYTCPWCGKKYEKIKGEWMLLVKTDLELATEELDAYLRGAE
jgi:hypothetical protein